MSEYLNDKFAEKAEELIKTGEDCDCPLKDIKIHKIQCKYAITYRGKKKLIKKK